MAFDAAAPGQYGPLFTHVEAMDASAVGGAIGKLLPRDVPVIVRGAARHWPAMSKWSFEALSKLASDQKFATTLQTGLIEQRDTAARTESQVAEYLQSLAGAEASPAHPEATEGLVPIGSPEAKILAEGGRTRLRFEWLASFKPDKLYLGLFDLLRAFPELNNDLRLAEQWRPHTFTFPFAWIGPARTVTGVHTDTPNNWFTQLRGSKEFLLFPPSAVHALPASGKYDAGAVPVRLDVTNLPAASADDLAQFNTVQGAMYVRVNPGDSLYVPKGWYHSVIALTPSISLSTFAHTPYELVTLGAPMEAMHWAHCMGLWRWGYCCCHVAGAPRPKSGLLLLASVALAAAAVVAARTGKLNLRLKL